MPETAKNPTFRAACITDFSMTTRPDVWEGKLEFAAWGKEKCPTTQRPHLQMFAYASAPMRLGGWKKLFPGANIRAMNGTFAQNEAYCSKEGQYETWGTKPMGNGRKRTLEVMKEQLDLGRQPVEVAVDHPQLFQTFVQYHNGLKAYSAHIQEKRHKGNTAEPFVQWSYGKTGLGKTRDIVGRHDDLFKCPDLRGNWFDGYHGQEAVLFDDVDPNHHLPRSMFLRLCDRYGVQVPVKGGFVYWKPKYIYFTSNYGLGAFYPKDAAVERRVSFVRVYKSKEEDVYYDGIFTKEVVWPEEEDLQEELVPQASSADSEAQVSEERPYEESQAHDYEREAY